MGIFPYLLRLLDSIRFKQKGGGASPHPPPTARADFDYFPPFCCCKMRTMRADLDYFPPFLCCRGRGTKVRPFYVKWAEISTFRPGGGRRAEGRQRVRQGKGEFLSYFQEKST